MSSTITVKREREKREKRKGWPAFLSKNTRRLTYLIGNEGVMIVPIDEKRCNGSVLTL